MVSKKALVLFSGGLDSILAVRTLQEQGIKVVGLTFKSYFFGAEQAEKSAKGLKIPLKIVDFSERHLKIVKNPRYGYGKGLNPCIDCHALMLKEAKKIMNPAESPDGDGGARKKRFDFVATGEVLGERPMSQNKQALALVEKESSLKGYLLRPLSARLLEETIPEKKEWVDRKKLFAISGRSRKKQMELAKKWKIKAYPTPAGGCLLTDLEFSKRLRELFKKYPKGCKNDIELLKAGRHFCCVLRPSSAVADFGRRRPKPKGEGGGWVKIVVGRNHQENVKLKELVQKRDILIELKDFTGPTTLIRNYGGGKISKEILEEAKNKTKYYSTKARNKKQVEFLIKKNILNKKTQNKLSQLL